MGVPRVPSPLLNPEPGHVGYKGVAGGKQDGECRITTGRDIPGVFTDQIDLKSDLQIALICAI